MNDVFSPPSADVEAPPVRRATSQITHNMLASMRATRPWVLLIGIMCMLLTVLMIGVSLFIMLAGGFGAAMADEMGMGALGAVGGLVLGGLYLLLSLIYALPGYFLLRYGGAIGRLNRSHAVEDMETALEFQKKFWRLVGILVLLIILLYVAIFAIAILASALSVAA